MKSVVQDIDRAVAVFDEAVSVVVTRPEVQFGDAATNVALQLANKLKRNPRDIAVEIAKQLEATGNYQEITVAGPGFINIRFTDTALLVLARELPELSRKDQTIVIETNNPNPFKAMHIGHALNAITADTIANLLDASGARVYRVSYHGDVGLHVGKSMYALLRYIDGSLKKLLDIPEAERNSFMSQMYAEGSQAYKEDEVAHEEIVRLARMSFTREDELYSAVYEMVFNWSFDQINRTVMRLGNRPTVMRFLESESDQRGVQVVKKNTPIVFQESGGALVFAGSKYGAFDNAFVSSNGLGLYAARDLGLMQLKNEQFHPEKSYIVTAEEQKDYFKGVIAAAELALPDLKGQTVNIPTGTLKLSTGKMSSRDGQVVEIAWLFDQITEAIKARGGVPSEEVIAGALRYAFLKVRVGSDVVFDINESVSIQGNSGPYLQYAHARACSILEKAEGEVIEDKPDSFDGAERVLVRKLSEYTEVLNRATDELMPHHICTYLYELAQEFNRFYEKSRIIGDERQAVRLGLVVLYRDTLARGLAVLGIVAPERM